MITFSRTDNSVEMLIGTDAYYLPTDMMVVAKVSQGKIYITDSPVHVTTHIAFAPTDVNGRPADDILVVAEWVRDTYFKGLVVSGGGGGDATAANQVTQINELNAIEADVEALVDKTPSDLVTELHDYKEVVYLMSGNIDYVAYKTGGSGGTEVARLTFTYNGSGDVIGIAKT